MILNDLQEAHFRASHFLKNQKRKPIDYLFYLLSDSKCANVYLFILAKPVSKLATVVGSFTALSTESSLMVKCLPIKLLAAATTLSIPFSLKLALENTFPEPCWLIWSPEVNNK